MLKKITVTFLIFGCVAWTSILANAQTSAENEFIDLIEKADSSFDVNDNDKALQYLSAADEILARNPDINIYLQAHSDKVKGKLQIGKSFGTALEYFNSAIEKFSGNYADKIETEMYIGILYYNEGDFRTAQSYFAQAKDFFGTNKDKKNSAQALNNLGVIAFLQGDAETAGELCRQALSINLEIRNLINAEKNRINLDYFSRNGKLKGDQLSESNRLKRTGGENFEGGGTGTTGTGTGGGGTVVIHPNGGFNR